MDYQKACEELAVEAGRIVRAKFGKQEGIKEKEGQGLVTEADLSSERYLLDAIQRKFPTHAVLSEEAGKSKIDSEYLWILDPLDGTNNFANNIPLYAVSVALAHQREVIAGAVYLPEFDDLYAAAKDGATKNGKQISVTSSSFEKGIFVTGFYYDRGEMMRTTLKQMQMLFEQGVTGIRRTGSAALDLCWVAEGKFAGFWEGRLSSWDYAAGKLIVEKAGGRVSTFENKPLGIEGGSVIACAEGVHKRLLQVLSTTF